MKNNIIKFKSKKKNKKIFLLFIIILAFFYQSVTYCSFARFNSNKTQNLNLKIAMPIVEIEGEEIKSMNNISDEIYYNFKVKNYNENGEKNEVEMQYYIEIVSEYKDSMAFELYKGEEKIELINYKTNMFDLKKETSQIDEYNLYITFDNNQIENINDYIEIKVHAIQKLS